MSAICDLHQQLIQQLAVRLDEARREVLNVEIQLIVTPLFYEVCIHEGFTCDDCIGIEGLGFTDECLDDAFIGVPHNRVVIVVLEKRVDGEDRVLCCC